MAKSMRFDTLDYAKKLEGAGVPAPQAEVQAKALAEVLDNSVAFPGDLTSLERNLVNRIDGLEQRVEARLKAVELWLDGRFSAVDSKIHLIHWMMGTLIALNVGVIVKVFTH